MKKLILLFCFFTSLSFINAQKQIVWFDAGLKAQYGASGFYNSAIAVSFINEVTDNVQGSTVERNDFYNKNMFSGVIGFGANIIGNDGAFSGILGLRFEYGLTDFVSDAGTTAHAPLLNAAVYSNGHKSTNVAFAGIVFELNWGIGYFAKAQCGARSKFIRF